MAKYRKKPVVIDAIQLTKNNIKEIYDFVHPLDNFSNPQSKIAQDRWEEYEQVVKNKGMEMYTLESGKGTQVASIGDFIIKGVAGEFYPCKPDIFEATYEQVEKKKGVWGQDIEECDKFFDKITRNAGPRD